MRGLVCSGLRRANSSMLRMATGAWSPASDRGSTDVAPTARKVVPGPTASSTRSSQPSTVSPSDPPRSRQSWAWKWLREMSGVETAGTAVNWPFFHSSCRGASAGWSPNPRSRGSSAPAGTAMWGREAARLGSDAGTTSESPSTPPRMKITISVPSPGAAP